MSDPSVVEKLARYLRAYEAPVRGGHSWLDNLGHARRFLTESLTDEDVAELVKLRAHSHPELEARAAARE